VFTFATAIDRVLDIVLPVILIGGLGTLSVVFYKKKAFAAS
jgi:hypothetical protein